MSSGQHYKSYSNYLKCRTSEKAICDLYNKYNTLLDCCDISGGEAGGNSFDIQFNNNGILDGDSKLTWDFLSHILYIKDNNNLNFVRINPVGSILDITANALIKGNLNVLNTNINILNSSSTNLLTIYNDTISSNIIQSNAVSTSQLDGLTFKSDNIYFDITGSAATRGMLIKLGDTSINTKFQIKNSVNASLLTVDGAGLSTFYGYIGSHLSPSTNGTYNLGESPNQPWGKLVINEISGSGIVSSGISANNVIFSGLKLVPKILYTQDIGLINNPFRTIYAQNIELGSENTNIGSLRAQNLTDNRIVNLKTLTGAEISGSGDDYSYELSTGLINGSSTAAGLIFTDDITSNTQVIITANPSTTGNSAKILNMGFDATCNNSPNSVLNGYQLQFSTGNTSTGGRLDVKSNINLYNGNNNNIHLNGYSGTINLGLTTSSQIILNNANVPVVDIDSATYTINMDDQYSNTRLTINSNSGDSINSENIITQVGGTQMNPRVVGGSPIPGTNITMGKYGWDKNGPNPSNVAVSVQNLPSLYGGSGNIYCNHIRENIYYIGTNVTNIGPTFTPGFTGNSGVNQYYNGGDLQYIMVNTGNCPTHYLQVNLPAITESMLGSTITIVRQRLNPLYYPGNNTAGILRHTVAVVVTPDPLSTDLLNCPNSIFVSGGTLTVGGVGIDPYSVSGAVLTVPVPYTPIASAKFLATQSGDGQNSPLPNNKYIWHYINEYPAV